MTKRGPISRSLAAAVLLLPFSLFGCADGGVGGTGISTVQGNVLELQLRQLSRSLESGGGGESNEGIVVREPTTGHEDQTDEAGRFLLRGRFPVDTTLFFFRATEEDPATMDILVVRGSEVTLENIFVQDLTAAPERIRVDLPPGRIAADAVCSDAGGEFQLEEDGLAITVLFESGAILDGRECEDLIAGTQVKVLGQMQQETRRVNAEEIGVTKSAGPR